MHGAQELMLPRLHMTRPLFHDLNLVVAHEAFGNVMCRWEEERSLRLVSLSRSEVCLGNLGWAGRVSDGWVSFALPREPTVGKSVVVADVGLRRFQLGGSRSENYWVVDLCQSMLRSIKQLEKLLIELAVRSLTWSLGKRNRLCRELTLNFGAFGDS